jgi:hypothetical protein
MVSPDSLNAVGCQTVRANPACACLAATTSREMEALSLEKDPSIAVKEDLMFGLKFEQRRREILLKLEKAIMEVEHLLEVEMATEQDPNTRSILSFSLPNSKTILGSMSSMYHMSSTSITLLNAAYQS